MADEARLESQECRTVLPDAQLIRRIAKACAPCRHSKLKCDGKEPCSRCRRLRKQCIYIAPSKISTDDRLEVVSLLMWTLISCYSPRNPVPACLLLARSSFGQLQRDLLISPEQLQSEVVVLREQLARLQQQSNALPSVSDVDGSLGLPQHVTSPHSKANSTPFQPDTAPQGSRMPPRDRAANLDRRGQVVTSPSTLAATSPTSVLGHGRKRTRSSLEVYHGSHNDFVERGLINVDQARLLFDAFFQGCDRFVPVFDPTYDTFDSIRSRSSFLFDAICTTGCTVSDSNTQLPHMLNSELKKSLNQVVLLHEAQSLETVQALLVVACYSPERSLILSFATRLAIDMDLPSAFEEVTSVMLSGAIQDVGTANLIRCSRTWFELLVLENMLQVDAGKIPAFSSNSPVRRCRVLLQHPQTTPLDLRLLSQVELNDLRTKTNATLMRQDGASEEDILGEVTNARIDIDLWFNDWKMYMDTSAIATAERPLLLVNLRVQRHWCEAMTYFRALKCLGTDNIDAMTPAGKQILGMAKAALKAHLSTTLEEPNYYLANLRFAMDFVWAKCAFCFLLVLKLTRLLPESHEDNYRLLNDGNKLYRQLSEAGSCAGSSTSRLYVQVLGMSLEKYSRALQQHLDNQPSSGATPTFFWESTDANLELQSFVPEQFVFEWNFPGLTLFSSPTAWQDFFDEYLLGFNQVPGQVAIPDSRS